MDKMKKITKIISRPGLMILQIALEFFSKYLEVETVMMLGKVFCFELGPNNQIFIGGKENVIKRKKKWQEEHPKTPEEKNLE